MSATGLGGDVVRNILTNAANSALLTIIAHARSGALDRAERLFREAGLDDVRDDPSVLSIKGRLLKDHALATSNWKRKSLYREAAEAYARAAEIGGASYPLINAATLAMLAGQQRQSKTLARRILARIDRELGETPYWRAATRAESQLLLGRFDQAKASLQEAIGLAPSAFEDHASTLRQFGLILDELGADKAWLDAFRPPRSMHFAGHMAVSPARSGLETEIGKIIEAERIGFGYGALAAGADILIAEALLDAGGELHLVLPAAKADFRNISVASLGGNWTKRFDAIMERATSVRIIGKQANAVSALEITLAAEIAMGNAVMQAECLMTEAVQLLILDRKSGRLSAESASAASAQVWKKSGRRQYALKAPRVRSRARPAASKRPNKWERLAALLRVEILGVPGEELAPHLRRLAQIFHAAGGQLTPARWTGDAIIAAFENPADAAETALAVAGILRQFEHFHIAAHYGIARLAEDPFGATQYLAGLGAAIPARIVLSTPASAIHASEDFAAVLSAGPASGRPRLEYIGDLPAEGAEDSIKLYSLKR
jgi:tetratricopeptide (TPR) repeat protein